MSVLEENKDFVPAGTTKGLSGRPLETFGAVRLKMLESAGLV